LRSCLDDILDLCVARSIHCVGPSTVKQVIELEREARI
jgi:hypothetical protein